MKKFNVFFTAFCVIFAALCIASASEAKVTITVNNNRSYSLKMAFRWSGFDLPDDRRSGWFTVPANTTKKFTIDVAYALTADSFGYYATGGGKVWQGKSGDLAVIIHPTKNFSGHPDTKISGGKKVYFRRVKLKGSEETGRGTLNFK
jgi:hypothetical protein